MYVVRSKLNFSPKNISKKQISQSSWKCYAFAELDDDSDAYYRWLIKRKTGLELMHPIRGPHISVINDKMDKAIFEKYASEYKDTELEFTITDKIRSNIYEWWVRVESDDAMKLRSAFGLGEPYFNLHLTIGIVKESEIPKSDYFVSELMRKSLK